MGRKQTKELSDKDLQALSLFEQGKKVKEIAATIGLSEKYVYHMATGDSGRNGSKAIVFKERLDEIKSKQEDDIAEATKRTRGLAIGLIEDILTDYTGKSLKDAEKKMVSLLTNSIAKLQPAVKIGNMSISYTNSFSLEELSHEYGRLRAASDGPTDSRRVQEDEPEGSGVLHSLNEPGSAAQEIPEDTRL